MKKIFFFFQLQSFFIVYPYGKQCCLSALELFHCQPPLFCCLPLWKTVRLHRKKLQNATNSNFWPHYKVVAALNTETNATIWHVFGNVVVMTLLRPEVIDSVFIVNNFAACGKTRLKIFFSPQAVQNIFDDKISSALLGQQISKQNCRTVTSPKNERTDLFFYPDSPEILET